MNSGRLGFLDRVWKYLFLCRYAHVADIRRVFNQAKCLYFPAYKLLNEGKLKNKRKCKRSDLEIRFPSEPCIEFLKEKKFIELEKDIENEKKQLADMKTKQIEAARLAGDLQECLCCYDIM